MQIRDFQRRISVCRCRNLEYTTVMHCKPSHLHNLLLMEILGSNFPLPRILSRHNDPILWNYVLYLVYLCLIQNSFIQICLYYSVRILLFIWLKFIIYNLHLISYIHLIHFCFFTFFLFVSLFNFIYTFLLGDTIFRTGITSFSACFRALAG